MTTTQDVALQLFYGGAWNDVPLYAAAGTKITTELDDDNLGHVKFECEIDNDSGDWDPENPLSPLYGKAGRNTPCRLFHHGSERKDAEASEYHPDETEDFVAGSRGRRWIKFTAEGPLRRIGRWTDTLDSALFGQISGLTTLVGYWPGEDSRDALAPTYTVGKSSTATGVSFGDTDTPAGSASSIKLATGAAMSGRFLRGTASGGWQMAWSYKIPAAPVSGTVEMIRWRTSNGYNWMAGITSTGYYFEAVNDKAAVLWSATASYGAGAEPGQWISYRVKVSKSGGTVTVEPAWYPQFLESPWGITDTFAGTIGALDSWKLAAAAANDDCLIGHIFGVQTVADDLQSFNALRSFDGYLGETAGARFNRITAQLGITRFVLGPSTETIPMGVQKPDTVIELFKEIARSEQGIIFDERYEVSALTRRSRRNQYNQTPKLALTYPTHITPPLKRVIGDVDSANIVTAKNRNGGEYTSTRLTGPRNVTADFPGVGEYRKSIDVNLRHPHDLIHTADFGRARGTVDAPRLDTIIVDVVEHPELRAGCEDMQLGDVITLTGYRADVLWLRVIKIVESSGSQTHMFEFDTEPYGPWRVAEYDDGESRYDTVGSLLTSGPYSTTFGTFTVTIPNGGWSKVSEPYLVVVAGEVCNVTNCFDSGANQGLTVTRAVNGVAKTHVDGEEVRLFDARTYGY